MFDERLKGIRLLDDGWNTAINGPMLRYDFYDFVRNFVLFCTLFWVMFVFISLGKDFLGVCEAFCVLL